MSAATTAPQAHADIKERRSEEPAGPADTNGWDTVYPIPYAEVNKSIAASGASPSSFSYQTSDGDLVVSGDFGDWRLASGAGASGDSISMALPLTGVSVEIKSQGVNVANVSTTATVSVKAAFQPGADEKSSLKIDASAGGVEAVEFVQFDPQPTGADVPGALELGLMDWLRSHLEDFDYVFAVIDLSAKIDKSGWEWLQPTYLSYAVAEPEDNATEDNSVFAVLTMTENRPPDDVTQAVSPYAVPPGSTAGFLISADRYIAKMVYPAVPALFKDDPPLKDFTIEDGTKIVSTKDQKFKAFTLKDGTKVHPTVGAHKFYMEQTGAYLKINVQEYEFGYKTAEFKMQYIDSAEVAYKPKTDTVTMISNPTVSGSVGLKEWVGTVVWLSAVVVDVIVAVLGAVVGPTLAGKVTNWCKNALEDGDDVVLEEISEAASDVDDETGNDSVRCVTTRRVLSGFFGALLGLAPGLVIVKSEDWAKEEYDGETDELPKVTPFTDIATSLIHWPSGSGFTVESIQLSDSLQFGGSPETSEN